MEVGRKEIIGILGGSFNPVHTGHMMIAAYLTQWGYVDKVWLTLSPLNPLKDAAGLLPDSERLAMLKIATGETTDILTCDIELSMPRPSYTIDTLDLLSRRHKDKQFKLIIGSDNWCIFDRWREHEYIWEHFSPIVYPRPGFPREGCVEMDTFDVSSTELRRLLAEGAPVNNLLPPGVENYIVEHGLYGASPGACK